MPYKDQINEVRRIIDEHQGERNYVINWEWAYFPSDELGQAAFDKVKDICEHRGFHKANPNASNPNFHRAAFRFR